MLATRLHRLATIYLAVLYGLVGVTGESLHYLVTDPTVLWSSSRSVETAGYYHTHAPDHHLHFHRHVHHRHHAHDAAASSREACDATPSGAIRSPHATHQPHACPILTLVSTLKLVHAVCFEPPIILDSFVTASCEREFFLAFDVAFHSYARGPPRANA